MDVPQKLSKKITSYGRVIDKDYKKYILRIIRTNFWKYYFMDYKSLRNQKMHNNNTKQIKLCIGV